MVQKVLQNRIKCSGAHLSSQLQWRQRLKDDKFKASPGNLEFGSKKELGRSVVECIREIPSTKAWMNA